MLPRGTLLITHLHMEQIVRDTTVQMGSWSLALLNKYYDLMAWRPPHRSSRSSSLHQRGTLWRLLVSYQCMGFPPLRGRRVSALSVLCYVFKQSCRFWYIPLQSQHNLVPEFVHSLLCFLGREQRM